MKAVFVELPAFERYRSDYLDDNAFGDLQAFLMSNPEAARANAAVFGSFITGGALACNSGFTRCTTRMRWPT